MPSRTQKNAKPVADGSDEELELPERPSSINPYTVLNVDKDATPDQVKSAYRRQALRHHPDKAAEADKASAHTKFQEIALAYAVLSDERRRRRYDITGSTDDSLIVDGEDGDFDWATFYRAQFEDTITPDKIAAFADEYKGSEEEADDVLAAYEQVEGDMTELYEHVMLSDPIEDEARFRTIIDKAIGDKSVQSYKKYSNESAKARQKRINAAKKSAGKEAREAEEMSRELGLKKKGKHESSMDDLTALIQQRQKGRESKFFEDLEEKYASPGAKRKRAADQPSEEAFAKNRKVRSKK